MACLLTREARLYCYKNMKQCSKCKEYSNNFGICVRNNSGLKSWCRTCTTIQSNLYGKTKKGLMTKIYSHQRRNCRYRNHQMPSYTLKELRKWCFNQDLFHKLYDEWTLSGYEKMLVPSIDRLDNYKSYTFDNIRIVTWQQNFLQSGKDIRDCKLIHGNKPQSAVAQYDLEGNFITEFKSQTMAMRKTSISQSGISSCCNGNVKTAGGYKWEHVIINT